jgi:hypothetical protein
MLPVGKIEFDSPEFKAFRKYALDHDVMIKLVANPKQPGKESFKRYDCYQHASGHSRLQKRTRTSPNCLRGYIVFPQFEHNYSAHFVDAGLLARRLGIVSIH